MQHNIMNKIPMTSSGYEKLQKELAKLINQDQHICTKCSGKIIKRGTHTSTFHDVYTDHEVKIQRLVCVSCQHEPPSTVRTLLKGTLSGALAKIQTELGASYTFRDGQNLYFDLEELDNICEGLPN